MSNWTITVPETGTNLIIDPECTALYNANGSTTTVDKTYARFGYTCAKVVTNNAGALEGTYTNTGTLGIPATAGTAYTFSVYLRGSGTIKLWFLYYTAAGAGNGNSGGGAVITLSNTGWTRYTHTYTAPALTAFLAVVVYTDVQQGITFYCDGFQVEAKSYVTTFMSGNQPGCVWNGLANGSSSTRDAQYRGGGKEVDLEATYNVKVLSPSGFGMPPLQNNVQPMSLQPGALFQSYKILPRTLTLVTNTMTDINSTQALFHQRRDNLINLLAPDIYRGSQPIVIGYTGASSTRTVYGQYRVNGGFEGTALTSKNESIVAQLLAVDPLLYEQTQEIATLNFTASLAADYAFGRINGTWQRFGTGFNGAVYSVAIDSQRNRIYFGGGFTTANGVTCNGIAYWDGTTFQPLGAATKGVTRNVDTIAIAPNGDIWAGGDFTVAGGSTTKGLAKWAAVGTSAPTVFNTATTFTVIRAIVIDINYRVYIGGSFTVFMGTANANHICYSSDQGTTWTALTATPPSGGAPRVYTIALDIDGLSIYFGGDFTAVGGVANTVRIARYSGGTITALATGIANQTVYTLTVAPNGLLFVGGSFTSPANYLARWDGAAWFDLAESNQIISAVYDRNTSLLLYLVFLTAAVKFYNGSKLSNFDIAFSVALADLCQITYSQVNDSIIVCTGTSKTPATSGVTTVTPSSSTQTYPLITITGTTTAGASSVLQFIENQSTAQRIYFNLTILAGETITIDLRPGIKSVTSNWRGKIYDNPLSNSDFANFYLLPGPNTIAAFMTGTTTGCNMIMSWQPVHWGVDGVSQ